MNNKSIIIILLFLIPISCLSQLTATKKVIDSMRVKYCIDENYLKRISTESATIPPPPPLTQKDEKKFYANFDCKKRYKIQGNEFLKLYPFEADSIVVSIPDDCYWQNGKEKPIGKMTVKQRKQFTDILYNYDVKKRDGFHVSMHDICGCGLPVPDVRLYFYHKGESNYLDIFAKGFVDSFTEEYPYKDYGSEEVIYESNNGIYWCGECNETYEKIVTLIEKTFKHKLKTYRYEEDNSCIQDIEVMELKEQGYFSQ